MVTSNASTESTGASPARFGPSPLTRAALAQGPRPLHQLAIQLSILARQAGALALRRAMVLVWIQQRDLADMGYSSFGAFVRERVDGSESWERALRRLLESPLEQVKTALCQGLITVRAAVNAPGQVAVDEQEAWLAEQLYRPWVDKPRRALHRVEGERAALVRRGRRLARLLLGRSATDREVDEQMVAWWCDRVPAQVLLDEAHATREAPPVRELDWRWCARGAPAETLVGPWSEPETLDEALAQLELVQGLQRKRRALLAHAWAVFDGEQGWRQLAYDSAERFAREVLDWSPSTAARYRKLGWRLEWCPELREAVEEWLEVERAEALLPVLEGRRGRTERWLALMRRIGGTELRRALRAPGDARVTMRDYEAAIAAADAWESKNSSSAGGGSSSAGGDASIRVALPHPEPTPRQLRRPMRVADDVVEAARWLLETVQVPAQRGFGKVKERDRYRCQNPECGRLGLRSHAHHEIPRSEGGADAMSNGITLCPACHLRLVHALAPQGGPRLTVHSVVVEGLVALLWTWADGRRVLQFREWPGRGPRFG